MEVTKKALAASKISKEELDYRHACEKLEKNATTKAQKEVDAARDKYFSSDMTTYVLRMASTGDSTAYVLRLASTGDSTEHARPDGVSAASTEHARPDGASAASKKELGNIMQNDKRQKQKIEYLDKEAEKAQNVYSKATQEFQHGHPLREKANKETLVATLMSLIESGEKSELVDLLEKTMPKLFALARKYLEDSTEEETHPDAASPASGAQKQNSNRLLTQLNMHEPASAVSSKNHNNVNAVTSTFHDERRYTRR